MMLLCKIRKLEIQTKRAQQREPAPVIQACNQPRQLVTISPAAPLARPARQPAHGLDGLEQLGPLLLHKHLPERITEQPHIPTKRHASSRLHQQANALKPVPTA
jgi:hypothetical protein